ncbi:MAG: ATP-dependent zinc metalloprotease FtsH [Zoogloea sp.]|uniref:ATP-dependent zinc metalloprotease FtsH n=1 Tax=Zoogloea sp. TaxID=49181 RepID=UPI001B589362|nr:ATP-dependent zinc metalloprotease FtsH [Zoogloea sp.]MBP8265897.1 ATP-dependent zinc metalloprotease FtsH [Zoogloea sp.]HQA09950.1 ATP-dependent zinc metalloprotease FtsH [Zoogloea sp.]HQE37835.1 ATP-dependent zinc metalloprotease FtsH [Zoogloea sp.]
MQKKTQFSLWYLIFALFAIFTLHDVWTQMRTIEPLPYSEFQRLLKTGELSEISITDNTIQGTFKKPLEDGRQKFVTTRVDPALAKDLAQYDVKFTGIVENTFLKDLLGWVLPAVIFVGIWIFAMKRFGGKQGIGGGFMNLGKSKAKVYVESNTGVTFDDVAGVDEAKDELKEVVGFLKDPKAHGRLGGRLPKGVLLVGPPGTGKTLLAKAVAGEAGVPFFSISGSEFVEMFVGVGAARVRDLFEQARAKAPAIIFIDELDAVGRARGAFGGMGGHDEKEQTLNQLLVELDGFDSSSGLVLLAATNRPEVLDPALLRAGRFDRQVLVDRPDKKGRIAILDVHMKKITLAPDANPEKVAALTPGFSGADLANLCNEAALVATRRNGEAVTVEDFTVAIERIVAGLEKKNRVLNEHERTVVAYHEMGHALVAMSLPGTDPVHKISIIPRGVGALGYTIQRPTEDRFLMTRAELENKMAVLLGGRAAELLVFGEVSTGAADDLQKVTSIARSIVMRFGMHEELGNVAYDTEKSNFLGQNAAPPQERSYSEETAREIDCAVREIVAHAFSRSSTILTGKKLILEDTARDLLSRETLDEADLKAIQTRVAEA